MAVTIRSIAEACGVSRGTVDRVLNNRGRVHPDTEERIRRTAQELGYKPNTLGKALASRKKELKIGIILCSTGNEFYNDLIRGIEQAQEENQDYGLQIIYRSMKGYDAARQLELMEELEGQINCLLLNAINDRRIAQKIREFINQGIGVITVNTDIEDSGRLAYVGVDVPECGRIACGLMGLITQGRAHTAIVTGSLSVLEHTQRIEGYREILERRYPKMEIVKIIEAQDDDITAFIETNKLLQEYPQTDTLFLAASGAAGVCRAVKEQGREDIIIIACDSSPTVVQLMQEGLIKATITQQPWQQGYRALQMAVEYLVYGMVEEKPVIENEIKLLENVHGMIDENYHGFDYQTKKKHLSSSNRG